MKLPVVDSKTMIKLLESRGFSKIGQCGSHVQFKNNKGVIITVPVHSGKDISRGLIRKIIRDLEVSREEFIKLLQKI